MAKLSSYTIVDFPTKAQLNLFLKYVEQRNNDKLVIEEMKEAGLIKRIVSQIWNATNAYRIGITGPPGSGKSSITNEIIKLLSPDKTIAVLSVDPTSPFTGGAILGDRIRMVEHYNNPKVFIRSIGSEFVGVCG